MASTAHRIDIALRRTQDNHMMGHTPWFYRVVVGPHGPCSGRFASVHIAIKNESQIMSLHCNNEHDDYDDDDDDSNNDEKKKHSSTIRRNNTNANASADTKEQQREHISLSPCFSLFLNTVLQ